MQTDSMSSDLHQKEDLHLMITTETVHHTLRIIHCMTLLLTHPTLMRAGIQVRSLEWIRSQRLFLLRVF